MVTLALLKLQSAGRSGFRAEIDNAITYIVATLVVAETIKQFDFNVYC